MLYFFEGWKGPKIASKGVSYYPRDTFLPSSSYSLKAFYTAPVFVSLCAVSPAVVLVLLSTYLVYTGKSVHVCWTYAQDFDSVVGEKDIFYFPDGVMCIFFSILLFRFFCRRLGATKSLEGVCFECLLPGIKQSSPTTKKR